VGYVKVNAVVHTTGEVSTLDAGRPAPAARRYVVLHPWPTCGGFAKRMDLLSEALGREHPTERIRTWRSLAGLLVRGGLDGQAVTLVFFTSLLVPLAVLLKLLTPGLSLCYMVRGDEYTYALSQRRRFRALVALCLQQLLRVARGRFVFVSWDLAQVFGQRLGRICRSCVLPNTLGEALPPTRPVGQAVAVVGDFGTVKNIESVIAGLSGGNYQLHLYGNRSLPEQWQRPWLCAHGVVDDLSAHLRDVSLVVLASVSEGFPNVLVEALQAGCGVVVHNGFPFRHLPVADEWRFDLPRDADTEPGLVHHGHLRLEDVIETLRSQGRDFRQDNPELVQLIESDWQRRVRQAVA